MIAKLNSKKFFFCDNRNLALGILAGVAAFGGVTLATPQKAHAGNIYGFSSLEWEASFLLNEESITFSFDAESDTRATLNEVTETDFDPFNGDGFSDAGQSYVDNNGAQNSTIVGENIFSPRQGSFVGDPAITSDPGGIGSDFVRGDAIASDGDGNIAASNVAELYIEAGEPFEAGLSEGQWDLLSLPINFAAGDELDIEAIFDYEIIAAITGFDGDPRELKEIQSVLEWDLEVIEVATGDSVGGIGFQIEEGLANINATDESFGTNVVRDTSITFGTDDAPAGIYEIVITGEERVTGSATQGHAGVPEPGTILGLLAIGGLGLGLKRKKQSKQLPV